jgi:hypothetical protein
VSFFTRQEIGRLYVIKMVLPDGTIVHKIGMTHSDRSVDRMLEILRSWFMKFRFVPYSELRLDMKSQEPALLEAHIHQILEPNRFEPNHKVEGGTEMFIELNEQRVIHYIRACENSPVAGLPGLDKKGREIIRQLLTG